MRTLTTTLLASALALSTTMVSAQGEPENPAIDPSLTQQEMAPKFEALDVNRDGAITEAEIPVESELSTLFASFDYDRDGRLSRTEFDAWAGVEEEDAE